MEIPDSWLDALWTAALGTPKKPVKTRRGRILTKWRRLLTKLQRKALAEAWNAGQTLLVMLGENHYGMGSSSRPDVMHILERDDEKSPWHCSCEAHGEFGKTAECRHIKRLIEIIKVMNPAAQIARLKRVAPNIGTGKVGSLNEILHTSAFH
jgi:hypothetical protein